MTSAGSRSGSGAGRLDPGADARQRRGQLVAALLPVRCRAGLGVAVAGVGRHVAGPVSPPVIVTTPAKRPVTAVAAVGVERRRSHACSPAPSARRRRRRRAARRRRPRRRSRRAGPRRRSDDGATSAAARGHRARAPRSSGRRRTARPTALTAVAPRSRRARDGAPTTPAISRGGRRAPRRRRPARRRAAAPGTQSATRTARPGPGARSTHPVGARAASPIRHGAVGDLGDVGAVHLVHEEQVSRGDLERAPRGLRGCASTSAASSPTCPPRLRPAYGPLTPCRRPVGEAEVDAATGGADRRRQWNTAPTYGRHVAGPSGTDATARPRRPEDANGAGRSRSDRRRGSVRGGRAAARPTSGSRARRGRRPRRT